MPRTSAPPPPDPEAGEHFSIASVTYQLRLVACGKPRCRCVRGAFHGPYWYAFRWGRSSVRATYVGKKLPPAVEATRRGLLHVGPDSKSQGGRRRSARVRTTNRVVRGPQLALPATKRKRKKGPTP